LKTNVVSNMRSLLLNISPTLEEGVVKNAIFEIINSGNSENIKVDTMLKYFNINFQEHTMLKDEVMSIFEELPNLMEEKLDMQVEEMYLQITRGYLLPEEQIYARVMYPMFPYKDEFTLSWSIGKALKIIKDKEIKKEFFPIRNMNISSEELDQDHFKNAIHNKKPAILVSYSPYIGTDNFNFLIDGNHRAMANQIKKNKLDYPVFKLSEVNTIKALCYKIDQRLVQLHLLLNLFKDINNMKESIYDENLLKYNTIKEII
jgi:hypothetical protein